MFACAQWGAVGEFAASRHGAFTRKQAADLGVSTKVIARLKDSGHVAEPLPGVLVVVGSVPTWQQQMKVATLGSMSAGVAGFRSAAALHRLDGYRLDGYRADGHRLDGYRLDGYRADGYRVGPIELIVPSWRRVLVGIAVQHCAHVNHTDVVTVDEVPCTGIARTLADLGSVDPVGKVRAAFESAWRRGISLHWMRESAERLHRPGQSGTRILLQLLDEAELAKRPTESVLELRLDRCLHGIEGVVRQHNVRGGKGRFIARVDFAVPHVRLAIEAHSREFHFGAGAVERDEAREHALMQQGWAVVYFGDRHLRTPAKVRAKVRALIQRREADFGGNFRL